MNTRAVLLAVIAAAGIGGSAAYADSTEFGFFNITNNGNDNLSGQLRMIVSSVDGNANQVDFTFRNLVGLGSSVKEVYFDNGSDQGGSLLAGAVQGQSGSNFEWGGACPPDLPGGNNLDVPFHATPGFVADSGSGGPATGLDNAADFLTIRFDLRNSHTYSDVIAAMFQDPALGGSLRVGLHITSIWTKGGSDSYVSTPLVPLPPAVYTGIGMLGVLAGAAFLRRRLLTAD